MLRLDVAMDTAKILTDNNITLAVHRSQIVDDGLSANFSSSRQIKEFLVLNATCSWTSTMLQSGNQSTNSNMRILGMMTTKAMTIPSFDILIQVIWSL